MEQIYLQFYLNKKFLHACSIGCIETIKDLIKYNNTKINYNYKDKYLKYNGFIFACFNHDFEVIKLLIKSNININFNENVLNYWGEKISPFKITIKNSNILKLLIKNEKYSNLKINYLYLKNINYDQELIDLMKTEKFLSKNNKPLILEFLRNIKILKSYQYQKILSCNKEDCSICLEPLYHDTYKKSNEHIICKLSCNHEFHPNCIDKLITSVKEWNKDIYEFDEDAFDEDAFDEDNVLLIQDVPYMNNDYTGGWVAGPYNPSNDTNVFNL